MTQAYIPGLISTQRVTWRVRRILPIAGEVLVGRGERVAATQVVARSLLPGPVIPVGAAQMLSVGASELPECMRKAIGETIVPGDLLAESPGIFGWFRAACRSPAGGTVETISHLTGQVLLRGPAQSVELPAWLGGTVVEVLPDQGVVIEADVTRIQGIFGVGGEAWGPLRMVCERPEDDLTEDRLRGEICGAVVVGGRRVTAGALKKAVAVGTSAIITGGIDDQDLHDFLGYDLGVATTGSERVGLTLIITEGFGEIAMATPTFSRLASRAGSDASVNGATQIRAGVVRPEIVIPWPSASKDEKRHVVREAPREAGGVLRAGAGVRVIRDPWFGIIGRVVGLPPEPRVLDSGSKARVVEVEFPTGERVVVPRANVELFEH